MDRAYRIRPWAGGWGVFSGDENVSVEPFRTPADAIIHAKELARRAGGAQICVHDEEGAVMSEFFYRPAEHGVLEHDKTVPTIAASGPARRRPRPDR
jgi:hypothetical protein